MEIQNKTLYSVEPHTLPHYDKSTGYQSQTVLVNLQSGVHKLFCVHPFLDVSWDLSVNSHFS